MEKESNGMPQSEKNRFADYVREFRKSCEEKGYIPSIELLLEELDEEYNQHQDDSQTI